MGDNERVLTLVLFTQGPLKLETGCKTEFRKPVEYVVFVYEDYLAHDNIISATSSWPRAK